MTNYEQQLTINLFNGEKITKTIKTDKQGKYKFNTFLRRQKFLDTFELSNEKTKFKIFIEGEEEEIKEITDFNASYFYLEEADETPNLFKVGQNTEDYMNGGLHSWEADIEIDCSITHIYGNDEIKLLVISDKLKCGNLVKTTKKLKLIKRDGQKTYSTESFRIRAFNREIYLRAYEMDDDVLLTLQYE